MYDFLYLLIYQMAENRTFKQLHIYNTSSLDPWIYKITDIMERKKNIAFFPFKFKRKKCCHVTSKARMLIWPADKLNIWLVIIQWSDNSVHGITFHRTLVWRPCWLYPCSLHHGTGHLLYWKEKCAPSLKFKWFFLLSIKSPPL